MITRDSIISAIEQGCQKLSPNDVEFKSLIVFYLDKLLANEKAKLIVLRMRKPESVSATLSWYVQSECTTLKRKQTEIAEVFGISGLTMYLHIRKYERLFLDVMFGEVQSVS